MTPEPDDPRDPLGLAGDAPLLEGWLRFSAAVGAGAVVPFTIPGHKQRTHLVGDVVRGDVPLYGGLDTMKQDGRLLVRAERRAAAAWGVDWCRLSAGGATHANQAAVLALGRPGQDVVITRTLHRSLLLARTRRSGGLLDAGRLERGFDATHTTSPAGAILASTDAARALLQQHGASLVGRLVELVRGARDRLAAVPGLAVLTGRPAGHPAGPLRVDPARLVVLLAGTGAHGHAVEADLLAAGITLEMADRDVLVPMVTLADDEPSVTRLVDALAAAIERHRGAPRQIAPAAAWTVEPATATDPRSAFFARHQTVPAAAAAGRVSAELIAPYPPGVPVLAPGEVISAAALTALQDALADGGRIAYAADPTLTTIQVTAR